jgi:hypothetical protein
MRPLLLPILVAGCAAGTGGPGQREADLSRELAGRTAGEPRDCVSASLGSNLNVRDRQTLVYRQGDTIWVNRLEAACPGLDPMSRLIVEVHGSQYCRGDRIRGAEPGMSIPGPSCPLGAFTPYRR